MLANRTRLTAAGLYHAQVFARHGCERPLIVVTLGASDEAAATIRSFLGAEMAYVSAGRVSPDVSGLAYRVHALAAGLSFSRPRVLPILAISPPPPDADGPYQPPRAGEWARLSARS